MHPSVHPFCRCRLLFVSQRAPSAPRRVCQEEWLGAKCDCKERWNQKSHRLVWDRPEGGLRWQKLDRSRPLDLEEGQWGSCAFSPLITCSVLFIIIFPILIIIENNSLILAVLPPVPTGQFLWVKQSSLSVWCSPKNSSSARSSEQTANHKVQLLVSPFLLVSRCLWVFPWKYWLVGVTDCYHGNAAQSVSPIAAMETPVNGCFLV